MVSESSLYQFFPPYSVSSIYARLLLPLGIAINMNGSVIYRAVAMHFLLQLNGADVDVGTVITVAVYAVAFSLGAMPIPYANVIVLTTLLPSLGLPSSDIGYIIAVNFAL